MGEYNDKSLLEDENQEQEDSKKELILKDAISIDRLEKEASLYSQKFEQTSEGKQTRIIFMAALKRYKRLTNELQSLEPSSYEYEIKKEELDTVLLKAYERIENFAFSLLNKMTLKISGFNLNKYKDDIKQEFFNEFQIQFPKYDPIQFYPTTFFSKYLLGVCSTFLNRETTLLTQSDSRNNTKVRKAYFKGVANGVRDEDMMEYVVNETQLSEKVVRRTLMYANQTQIVRIDQTLDDDDENTIGEILPSNMPTPEDIYARAEDDELLREKIFTLNGGDPDAVKVFDAYIFDRITGDKFMATRVAAVTGIDKDKVESIYRQTLTLMFNDAEIQSLYERIVGKPVKNKFKENTKIFFSDNTSLEQIEGLETAISRGLFKEGLGARFR